MGKRGKPPKPTGLKLLQGNPGGRKLNKNEPKPKRVKLPRPPFEFSLIPEIEKRGKKHWKNLCSMLDRLNLLTEADVIQLARYVDTLLRWEKVKRFLDEKGEAYPIKDDRGQVKAIGQFPQVAMYHKFSAQLSKMESQFGMTPAARVGLAIDVAAKTPGGNPLHSFMYG